MKSLTVQYFCHLLYILPLLKKDLFSAQFASVTSSKMGKVLALVLMVCVASATSHIIKKTVWPATKACQEYHIKPWTEATNNDFSAVKPVQGLRFTFDVVQFDNLFALRYNETFRSSAWDTNLYFDLYKRTPDTKVKPLSHDERPKLFVTNKDGSTFEYSLKFVEIDLPYEIYDNNNHSPDYVNVHIRFSTAYGEDDDFVIVFPVFEAHLTQNEDSVSAEVHIGDFLRSLVRDGNARDSIYVKHLTMLKPALESLKSQNVPVYHSNTGHLDYVAVAPCKYTDRDVFRPLYDNYHTPQKFSIKCGELIPDF